MFRGYLHEMFKDEYPEENDLEENAIDSEAAEGEGVTTDSYESQSEDSIINTRRHGILKNQTCVELLIGSALFFVIGEILLLVLVKHKIYESIGFIEGVLISVGMILHMTVSLEQAMCMNEKGAYMHVRKTAAIRLTVVIILLIVIGYFDIGSIVAVLIGTFALKVSAYLQPLTHKALAKKCNCSHKE